MKSIQVHVQSLAQIVDLTIQNFESRREYHHYRKQRIYQYRDDLIARVLDAPVASLSYATAEQGKPYLLNTPLQFNHSHSQNDYALAMSLDVEDIGVDIESLDRKIHFDALAKHAFHPQEYQYWQALGQDPHYWLKVWTTKEALLKAHGMGIRLDLNTLNTQMHIKHDNGQISDPRLGRFSYRCFDLEHAILSVAWRSETKCGELVIPRIQVFRKSVDNCTLKFFGI